MDDTQLLNWLEGQDGAALINDDNGHWAFASDGIQNMPDDIDDTYDLASVWWVEKHSFKPTIREAIIAAMAGAIE